MIKVLSIVFLLNLTFICAVQANGADHVLRINMAGDEVVRLQKQLSELGYYTAEIDGYFGFETQAAVIRFQTDNGLEADGVVGASTISEINRFKNSGRHSRYLTVNQHIVSLAKKYLNVPYIWAGFSPEGFDCSGFVYYIFDYYGIKVPRSADEQFETGIWVKKAELQIGDLVFFSTYETGPSHVGIYIGENQFIHASSGAGYVTITPLDKPYYQERYIGARRVIAN